MKDTCFLCDFDGTITEKDGLNLFFSRHAEKGWLQIEKLWENNKISSKECLQKEFELVPNLSAELISAHIKTILPDSYFKKFYEYARLNGADVYIVSGGADYFINKTLELYNIKGINVISNHFELNENGFSLSFPNDNSECSLGAGTCKCSVLKKMKKKYKKVVYAGDGISDFCVCSKADLLFAKGQLAEYCLANGIPHVKFESFKDIISYF